MSVVWIAVAVALLVVWAFSVADIVRRPLTRQQTAAWLLIVLMVPFVGAIAYWAMRKPAADEVALTEAAER